MPWAATNSAFQTPNPVLDHGFLILLQLLCERIHAIGFVVYRETFHLHRVLDYNTGVFRERFSRREKSDVGHRWWVLKVRPFRLDSDRSSDWSLRAFPDG